MGWFKDRTGVSSRDAIGASMLGMPLDPATMAVGGQVSKAFQTEKDPGTMALNQGVMQGVNSLSEIAYDDQGNLIIPQYRAPGALSQSSLAAMAARSQNDPLAGLSEQYYTDVLGGGSNPYLDAMYQKAAGKVRSGLSSQFEAAGRYGGSDHEIAMGGALGDLATNIYGGAYESDMARRERAAQVAPSAGYENLLRQYSIGQMQDELGREEADWDYNAGMDAINQYLSALGVAKGDYTAQPNRNRGMEALSILTSLGKMAAAIPTGGASMAVTDPFAGQGYGNYGGYS